MKRDSRFATDTEICTEDTDSDGIPDYWEKEYGLDFKKMMRMNGLLMLMVNILISRCI